VKKVVITVPAYFNDNQRTATKDAGKIAGLEVVRLVNEPTAASMAYGLDKGGEHKILVFDLGGGTLDVTIMEFGHGTFTVLSTSGDTQLGGTDMDKAVMEWIVEEFRRQEGVDLMKDRMAVQRVREAAEKAKIELSTVVETEINLPYITADREGPKHLSLKITRGKLEQLIAPIISQCVHPLEQALSDAKLSAEQVDRIILVGGPTRMPVVQKFVEDRVGKKVERGVDPMECVAMGAAIQAAILAGEVTDLLLLDVTPLTLGIETLGGVRTPLIERNTTIPTRKSQIFSTAADYQPEVDIHVLQGERPMAADNVSLGKFKLMGIPPAPRGVPQIEVTFDIDASGILNVAAKDLGTGKEQKMTITASTKLPEKDVQRMVQEAQQFAAEDERKKDEATARNEADTLVYTAEKTLSEAGEKIPAELKGRIEAGSKAVKEALAGKDIQRVKSETANLQKVLGEAGSAIYAEAQKKYAEEQAAKQAGAGAGEGPEGAGEKKGPAGTEDAVDADFRVKED
jgi:molecular chaperone DnaK